MSDDGLGARLHRRMERLYPICRSISGDGLRATLDIIGEELDLDRHRVPSGTQGVRLDDQRRVERPRGLHRPVGRQPSRRLHRAQPARDELQRADRCRAADGRAAPASAHAAGPTGLDPVPDALLRRNWGVLPRAAAAGRDAGRRVRVVVDSTIEPGFLDYGELVVPGESDDEVLFSAHVCHPSLANDNLSGIAVADRTRPEAARAVSSPIQLSLRLRPRHHRFADLAQPQPDGLAHDQGRSCPHRARRRRPAGLQAHPATARRTSTAASSHVVERTRRRGARLLPLRLRRAPVQRRRVRPSRRQADPDPARTSIPSTTPPPTTSPSSTEGQLAESFAAVRRDRRRARTRRRVTGT